MLIRTVVAPLLETNCYLVEADGALWVVDPGAGAAEQVDAVVAAEGLVPAGVLLTHGHLDHTWDAAQVADRYGIPVHVHADDAYRLADPVNSLGPVGAAIAAMAGAPEGPPSPERVVPFGSEGPLGVPVRALHAPGHTEGSTVYLLDAEDGPVALTGDVLFAGSVGRTDFPGSDPAAMATSLRRLTTLDPATRVLPGHGPATTVAAELAHNPYLRTA